MKIKRISYKQHLNTPNVNSWILNDTYFDDLTLLLGKNATGKSKLINVISSLIDVISNQKRITEAAWDIDFSNEGKIFKYICIIKNEIVEEEIIKIDGEVKLERKNAEAKIFSETRKEFINIHPPKDKLVLHIRRDEKEYSFFEDLYDWAENSVSYRFAFMVPPNQVQVGEMLPLPNLPTLDQTTQYWDKLDEKDIESIIEEMNFVGFKIEKVNKSIFDDIRSILPFKPKLLFVKEKEVKYPIAQVDLSLGMFGVLSLLIAIHYLSHGREKKFTSVFIDDLGSNLDYERSSKIAKILKNWTNSGKVQVVATTNDQFLANAMSLDNIVILKRTGSTISSTSKDNSEKIFDDFKLTGLDNFDLLSSDFLNSAE